MQAMKTVVWDPLRKKEVALTPEERVRQWCIGVLKSQMGVPEHMMMSEAGFKLGEKQFRADILVYDRQARPLVVVECKRPEVEITQEVLDQAVRYNMVLNVKYMMGLLQFQMVMTKSIIIILMAQSTAMKTLQHRLMLKS